MENTFFIYYFSFLIFYLFRKLIILEKEFINQLIR